MNVGDIPVYFNPYLGEGKSYVLRQPPTMRVIVIARDHDAAVIAVRNINIALRDRRFGIKAMGEG